MADIDPVLYLGVPLGEILKASRAKHNLTQQDVAVRVNRDKSYISRVEGGRHLPTLPEIEDLLTAFGCDLDQREAATIAFQAAVELGDVTEATIISTDMEDMGFDALVRGVKSLRLLGDPVVGYELSTSQVGRATRQLRASFYRSVPPSSHVTTDVVELILEQTKCALDFMTKSQIQGGVLQRSIALQRTLALTTRDDTAYYAQKLSEEAIEYAAGNVIKAHAIGLELVENLPDFNSEWTSEILRAVAINSGLLEDDRSLRSSMDRYRSIGGLLTKDREVFVVEGFARGYSKYNPSYSVELVEQALEICNEISVSPLRKVQLARTRAIAEMAGGRSGLSADCRSQLEFALADSRVRGYRKYEREIGWYLGESSS